MRNVLAVDDIVGLSQVKSTTASADTEHIVEAAEARSPLPARLTSRAYLDSSNKLRACGVSSC